MCQTVVFDDGENRPVWEAETCSELSRRLGGTLVRDPLYSESVDVSGENCLCAVDLEETAAKFGLLVERDDPGFEVILRKAMRPVHQHTFDGKPCSVVGREFTSHCPYVVVRFANGTEARVKAWELEPKVPVYAK